MADEFDQYLKKPDDFSQYEVKPHETSKPVDLGDLAKRAEGLMEVTPGIGPVITAGRAIRDGIGPTVKNETSEAEARLAGVSSNAVPYLSGKLNSHGASFLPSEHDFSQAVEAHPEQFAAGAIAQPNPFGKVTGATGILGRVGINAASNAATTALGEGEHSGADIGKSAFIGGAGSAVSEVPRVFGSKMGQLASTITSKRAARDAADVGEEIASQAGKVNKVTSEGARDLEVLRRESPYASPSVANKAVQSMASPEAASLTDRVVGNKTKYLPEHLQEESQLRAELNVMRDNATTEARRRTAEYFGKSPIKEDIAPRVGRYVGRLAGGAVGAYAGEQADEALGGHHAGPIIGGIVGGAVMGKPGTAFGNAMREPRVQRMMAQSAGALADMTKDAAAKAGPRTFAEWLALHKDEK